VLTRDNKPFFAVWAVVAATVALGGLVVATVASLPRNATATSSLIKPQPQAVDARPYLGMLGLSAEALAAAGVTPQQAGRVMVNLRAYMNGDGAGLQATIDAWGTANTTADRSRRGVQSSKGRVDELEAANGALATALAAKQSAINSAFSAAVAELDGAVADTLVRIRTNKGQGVPVQYLVADRTGPQWRKLRDALSQRGIMLKRGEPLDEFNAAIVSQADGEVAVSTAANLLATNLEGVKQAMAGDGQVP
jgi:hypothetical protein